MIECSQCQTELPEAGAAHLCIPNAGRLNRFEEGRQIGRGQAYAECITDVTACRLEYAAMGANEEEKKTCERIGFRLRELMQRSGSNPRRGPDGPISVATERDDWRAVAHRLTGDRFKAMTGREAVATLEAVKATCGEPRYVDQSYKLPDVLETCALPSGHEGRHESASGFRWEVWRGHARLDAWKASADDGSLGFDLTHQGRSLGAVTFAAGGGEVEIVLRARGVEAGVAQTGSQVRSASAGGHETDRASGEERRPSKPTVPGSIPGPSLDPPSERGFRAAALLGARIREWQASGSSAEVGRYVVIGIEVACARYSDALAELRALVNGADLGLGWKCCRCPHASGDHDMVDGRCSVCGCIGFAVVDRGSGALGLEDALRVMTRDRDLWRDRAMSLESLAKEIAE